MFQFGIFVKDNDKLFFPYIYKTISCSITNVHNITDVHSTNWNNPEIKQIEFHKIVHPVIMNKVLTSERKVKTKFRTMKITDFYIFNTKIIENANKNNALLLSFMQFVNNNKKINIVKKKIDENTETIRIFINKNTYIFLLYETQDMRLDKHIPDKDLIKQIREIKTTFMKTKKIELKNFKINRIKYENYGFFITLYKNKLKAIKIRYYCYDYTFNNILVEDFLSHRILRTNNLRIIIFEKILTDDKDLMTEYHNFINIPKQVEKNGWYEENMISYCVSETFALERAPPIPHIVLAVSMKDQPVSINYDKMNEWINMYEGDYPFYTLDFVKD
jgi:hypothetical protein